MNCNDSLSFQAFIQKLKVCEKVHDIQGYPQKMRLERRPKTLFDDSEVKGSVSRKVVELSMQCCGKLLSDSFETY